MTMHFYCQVGLLPGYRFHLDQSGQPVEQCAKFCIRNGTWLQPRMSHGYHVSIRPISLARRCPWCRIVVALGNRLSPAGSEAKNMSGNSVATLMAVQLPRAYDVELLQRDLQTLRDVPRAPQPGPYHKGDWTGIALHSMGGRQSVFPSAPGTSLVTASIISIAGSSPPLNT